MEKYINYLKITYTVQIVLGIIVSAFLAFYLGIMATDSPSSTILNFILGAVTGFVFGSLFTVLIPYLSIKELEKYPDTRLIFNYVTIIINIIFISFFIPLGLLQLYFIFKLLQAQK